MVLCFGEMELTLFYCLFSLSFVIIICCCFDDQASWISARRGHGAVPATEVAVHLARFCILAGVQKICPGDIRKAITTGLFTDDPSNEAEEAAFMNHSRGVHRQHYLFADKGALAE